MTAAPDHEWDWRFFSPPELKRSIWVRFKREWTPAVLNSCYEKGPRSGLCDVTVAIDGHRRQRFRWCPPDAVHAVNRRNPSTRKPAPPPEEVPLDARDWSWWRERNPWYDPNAPTSPDLFDDYDE